VENTQTVLKVPVAHEAGRYFADGKPLKKMQEKGQVLFRYCNGRGEVSAEANPNGSVENIAGICNEKGNVWGMMPHPERCAEEVLGNTDGRILLEGWMKTIGKRYVGLAV
ncbi:MAG: phosphoribosylformylglycinamidine synthase subunit PurQ, partial [Bacteroidales bacterium]|nr:phosphoribosylformylglycinamidine synthase subunit PurQ [Bacteroidales bacterium]